MDDFLPTSTGVIITLVVLAVLITMLLINRSPLINGLYRRLSPHPVFRTLLRPVADKAYPAWRRDSGRPRADFSTAWRIGELRRAGRPRFVVVGGVYLDLTLQPVTASKLDDNEFYSLDTPSLTCGGSAIYFGRALHRRAGVKSHLYTRLGASEPFSDVLRDLLARESWIRGKKPQQRAEGQCGVSVHLVQEVGDFHTTFTHTGALSSLEWSTIKQSVDWHTQRGGVLYIAGFFRTGLHTDLRDTLQHLSYELLVCLEHGRFRAAVNPSAVNALLAAFRKQLIDVYLCTASELCELMEADGLVVRKGDPRGNLEYFAEHRRPPPIVIVRSPDVDGAAVAHLLYNGAVSEFRAEGSASRGSIGAKGDFNATFVHALVTGPGNEDTRDIVASAARQAVNAWAGRAERGNDVSSH